MTRKPASERDREREAFVAGMSVRSDSERWYAINLFDLGSEYRDVFKAGRRYEAARLKRLAAKGGER